MRTICLCLVLLAACGSNKGAGQPADAPGDGEQGTGPCGGLAGIKCSEMEYCDYSNNQCGDGDQAGTCKPQPRACPLVVGPPICGCDGMVHDNECDTYATGTDLDANGNCPVDPARFVCGYTQCVLATQYCRRTQKASGPATFACVPLPPGCMRDPSCGCLAAEQCGNMCTGEAKGGFTLTCS